MDNELNKDLTPEEEAVAAEEAAEETVENTQEAAAETEDEQEAAARSKVEAEIAARIEKRFSKYPDPSELSDFAVDKKQQTAFEEYKDEYESYSQLETSREKRKAILRLNSLYYNPEMSPVIVACEASKSNDAAQKTVDEMKKLRKTGKIVSGIFIAVFLALAVIFTVVKIVPNVSAGGGLSSLGFYAICLAVYVALSAYAAVEVKNLFASMGVTKAQKLLPTLENVPAKLESEEIAELADPCISCGEKPQTEGSDYCEDCHAKMLSTKIPFLGWLAGAGIIAASVVALVALFFTAAPAFYGLSAEVAAKEKRWDDALNYYSQMNSTVNEFSSYLEPDSFMADMLKVGKDIQVDTAVAYANAYGAIEAVQYANYYLTDSSIFETEEELAPYMEIYTRYYNTAGICSGYIKNEDADYEEYRDALMQALDDEGVDKSIIYYTLFNLASGESQDYSVQLDFLSKAEQSAEENGYDYLWLYGNDYASTLRKAGEYEKALEYYDRLTENNKNDMYSYLGKAKALVSLGRIDEAEALAAQLEKEQGENEFSISIEALVLRAKGEYDLVEELCTTAFEEYDTSAELHHQLALTYLLKGDYDSAYEHAYLADYNGIYWAQQGVSKAYSYEYLNSLFLSANLCVKEGTEQAQTAQNTITELEAYGEVQPEIVSKIINGEVTVEELLTKGAYDII